MDRPADSKPFVYLPLVGARAGEAGGFAMIDAEDEELVKSLGPWYRADLLSGEHWKPAVRNQWLVEGDPVHSWTWLHNFVMGISDKHVAPSAEVEVYAVNGYWLDCRKSNLGIQEKSKEGRD
jgi:hypothetical protein